MCDASWLPTETPGTFVGLTGCDHWRTPTRVTLHERASGHEVHLHLADELEVRLDVVGLRVVVHRIDLESARVEDDVARGSPRDPPLDLPDRVEVDVELGLLRGAELRLQ